MAAATVLSLVCYNHPEKKADFKCFDCKLDSIINLCAQCNIQVHSLDVFRAHRVEQLVIKERERRLSQDIDDIEKLLSVESDLLQNVLIRLKYCQQEEKETLSHLLQLQTATKRRLAEINECETRIDKAFNYLKKVSSVLTRCTSPVENSDSCGNLKDDPFVPEVHVPQVKSSEHVLGAPQQLYEHPEQGPGGKVQNGPPEEHPIRLPDEIKGKDIFPVTVVGSLVRNGSFWMIKTRECDLDKQRQIQAGIRMHYQTHGYGGTVEPSVGTLCTTLNRFNKQFCRVRIESVASSGMVKLRFVDFGLVEEVPRSSLCHLPKEFADIPFQAMECCLLSNLDTQLPYEAKWCFKDLTFNKILMAALEGQVVDKKGHCVHHVTLASCSEVPICINTKVAKLVEEQRQSQEERPLQPKADKVENSTVVGRDAQQEIPVFQKDPICSHASETDTNVEAISVTFEEKEEMLSTDYETSATDETASSTPSDNSGVAQISKDSSPTLRVEAAEFVPSPPENSPQGQIPFHAALDRQNNVPGILHLPVPEDKTVNAKPEDESWETLPETQLPTGCVDFATYNHIITQCSMNLIPVEVLPKARFIMIKSTIRRVVESMKCGFWCATPDISRWLNRVFNEQAKAGNPVFLLFAGPKSLNFCGVAQMVTPIDPNGSCPTLNKSFRFANKMVGRCTLKWIYAHDILFIDVLSSNSGFNKWYLAECGDGVELPNKLGQLIIKSYDSSNNFRSILQHALECYQTYLIEQQVNDTAQPLTGYKPQEPQETLPMSQEEDWDLEIEESLKAAKSLEPKPKDINHDEKEVDACVPSTAGGPASVEAPSFTADASGVGNDGRVHSPEISKISDSVAFSSEQEEDTEVVNVQEEVVLPQDNDNFEAAKDHSQSCVSSSSEMSLAAASEGHISTTVADPSYPAEHVEGSAPDDVPEDDNFDPACNSDWESSSPPRYRNVEVESTASEIESYSELDVDNAVIESQNNSNSQTDAHQIPSSRDVSLQSYSISDACGTAPEKVVSVPESRDRAVEPASKDGKLQPGDVSDTKLNLNELSQNELPEPGVSNSASEVVPVKSNPVCAGDPVDSLSGDKSLMSEGGNIDNVNAEIPSPPEDEAKYREMNGRGEAQLESHASSFDEGSEAQLSLGSKGDVDAHGSSEDLLIDCDDLPVEIGEEHYIFPQDNLSSIGTFWARVHRTKEEERSFVDKMKRMGTCIEAKNQLLDNIFIYKHCAVRGYDRYWYRALVEKTPDKGKVGIRLLDLGEYLDVDENELRVLDDEFYASPPAQAFECSVCYENPGSKKEKARISRVVKKNKKIKVLVKSCNEGIVGVQVLS